MHSEEIWYKILDYNSKLFHEFNIPKEHVFVNKATTLTLDFFIKFNFADLIFRISLHLCNCTLLHVYVLSVRPVNKLQEQLAQQYLP